MMNKSVESKWKMFVLTIALTVLCAIFLRNSSYCLKFCECFYYLFVIFSMSIILLSFILYSFNFAYTFH